MNHIESINIIIIEDNPNDAEMIINEIHAAGISTEWVRVETAQDLLKQIQNFNYDIVISDYHLPLFGVSEALTIIQKQGKDAPFIIVSGAIGEETAVALMKSGVNDYVMKDNIKRLPEAIRREIREAHIREDNRLANRQIREALLEKEILIKEIHHRVKNNLQIIMSMINLQCFKTNNPDFIGEITILKKRIGAIAHVHEIMYATDNFSKINLHEYIKRITNDLCEIYNAYPLGITLYIQGEPIEISIEKAIPCGLVINELVTNSLKYAFEDIQSKTKEIRVDLRQNGGVIIIIISDNGSGKINTSDDRINEFGGLAIVNQLIKQLNGSVNTKHENGTTVTVSFDI
jgi:two-component sensor histidine kinase